MLKIMIAEDERIIANDLRLTLGRLGYGDSVMVFTGDEALKKAAETHPDLVIMDVTLKGKMDGIEAAQRLREEFGIPVVYLSAHTNKEIVRRAESTNPLGYIVKPFEEESLRAILKKAELEASKRALSRKK